MSVGVSNIERYSTIATDPLRNFRFQTIFTPRGTAFNDSIALKGGFQEINGLEIGVTRIAYREGGYNTTAHFVPGMAEYQDLSFARGAVYGHDGAINWMRGLLSAASGEGLATGAAVGDFRCDIEIYLMDHPNSNLETNTPRMKFKAYNAWPTLLRYSDMNATASGLMFETIRFVHEGLSVFYVDADGNQFSPNNDSGAAS